MSQVFSFSLKNKKIFTCFLLKTKLLSVCVKSLKNNFIKKKKGPERGEKINPLPQLSFPPLCSSRLRGLCGCLGREEAEVGPLNDACCWGPAEREGRRIAEWEEPK